MTQAKLDTPSAAQAAADWLVRQMQDDGSIRGATSINEYYKAVFGLAAAGRHNEADRMLDYVVRRFLKDDGDLDGEGCVWFDDFRIYAHAWVLMAGVVRARFDVVHRISRFLERFHDEQNGGFYGTLEQNRIRGRQEMMTTGVVAIAMLWAGRVQMALHTGSWMKKLFDAQPDLTAGLYFVWDRQAGLVTDFPSEQAKAYWVDAAASVQHYFQYGIPAAFCSSLSGATGDEAWLALAQRFLRASGHANEDVYRQPQSGKIGWGAAWTYRLSGDEQDRRLARTVADNLSNVQDAEGWWSSVNVYDRQASGGGGPSIDATGEFIAHLSWIENALAASA